MERHRRLRRLIEIDVRFERPAPVLEPMITSYYFVSITGPPDAVVMDLLHPEWANIRFVSGLAWQVRGADGIFRNAPTAALFGPTSTARTIRGGPGLVTGIGLTPVGWRRLIGTDASQLANQLVDLATIPSLAALPEPPGACTDDRQRALRLNAMIESIARPASAASARTARALELLRDPDTVSVEGFADAAGLSVRQLEHLCKSDFGFTPKLLLARQRFLRTLGRMRERLDEPWVSMIDSSYVDQSHFNRDFRRFMGLSPSQYFALPRIMLEPAGTARKARLGAPLQGLHR